MKVAFKEISGVLEETSTRNIEERVIKTTGKCRKNTVLFGHVKCGTYRHIPQNRRGRSKDHGR